ncbi:MAG TPA: transglutaminase domain-containing protein, partial [Cyclobacteriaceae bacterium]
MTGMKNILCFVIPVLLACFTASAQRAPVKFGDIPMEDMKMTVYPKDSSAAAVVLADYAVCQIENLPQTGWGGTFERIYRVKILTRDGLKHGNFMIPLYRNGSSEERITMMKVVTYNLVDGKIVATEADKGSIFKDEFNKNFVLKKVAWTNVKEGSILEISYRTDSDFTSVPSWNFQTTIPVRHSEYRTSIPDFAGYQKNMQGYITLAVNETSSRSSGTYFVETARMVAKDVPAFKEEPFMTTSEDYISRIVYELAYLRSYQGAVTEILGTWEQIAKLYWKSVQDKVKGGDGALKEELDKAIAGATTDEQKLIKVYEYVRDAVMWNDINSMSPSQSPKKVLETKKGTAADINTLLAAMIEKLGITVYPVLLSTRSNGFVRVNAPLISQFNYVVCAVQFGDKMILLDATSRMLPLGLISEKCLNGPGLVVTPTGFDWLDLKPLVKSRTSISADIVLDVTGQIDATLNVEKTGYHSVRSRDQYHKKGETEYVKAFLGPSWTVASSEFADVKDVSLSFKEKYKISISEPTEGTAGTIFLNPFILGREAENPFKTKERLYPVDFGNTFDRVYMAKIKVPEGYIIDEIPQSKMIALPGNAGRYSYNFQQNGDVVNFSSFLSINRSLFLQDEYPNLREFYNQMIAKQEEQIVFKKK